MDLASAGILQSKRAGGIAVLGFERGRLKEESEILTTLESLGRYVAEKKELKILLDMSNVEYLSSAGLGQLVGLLKKTKTGGGDFKLCGLQEAIKELFDVMRLNMIFEIYPTESEALAAFECEAETESA